MRTKSLYLIICLILVLSGCAQDAPRVPQSSTDNQTNSTPKATRTPKPTKTPKPIG